MYSASDCTAGAIVIGVGSGSIGHRVGHHAVAAGAVVASIAVRPGPRHGEVVAGGVGDGLAAARVAAGVRPEAPSRSSPMSAAVSTTAVRIVSEAAGAAPIVRLRRRRRRRRRGAGRAGPWPTIRRGRRRTSCPRAEAADEVGDVRQAAEIGARQVVRDVARVDAEAAEDAAEATEGFGAVASGHLRHGVGHRLDDLVEVAQDRALGIDGVEHLATEVAQRFGLGQLVDDAVEAAAGDVSATVQTLPQGSLIVDMMLSGRVPLMSGRSCRSGRDAAEDPAPAAVSHAAESPPPRMLVTVPKIPPPLPSSPPPKIDVPMLPSRPPPSSPPPAIWSMKPRNPPDPSPSSHRPASW